MSSNIVEKLRSKFKTEEGYQKFLKVMLWGTLGLIFIVFAFLIFRQSAPVKKNKKVNFAKIINKKKFQKEQWILHAQNKINRIEVSNKKSNAEISLLKKEVHDEAIISQSKKANSGGQSPATGRPAGHVFNPPIPGLPNNNQQTNYRPAAPVNKAPMTITEVANPINVILNSVPENNKKNRIKKKRKPTGFYIPAGTFTEGLLLNGLDAPASMKGKSNPYPTLIRLTNLSFLPNRFRLSMKGCFVLAEGYGSLSSERVYLRTVTLSCVVKGGKGHISAPIKGYIVGEHGKVGLRGKVVTKQGAILAREFVAGLLQGFGSVVQEQSQTLSYSALGSTSTINPSHIGEAGLGQGLGTAAGELSKFYSKMANSMMPVVVVGAGRKLTLVLTHGFYATFKKNVTYSKNNLKKKGVKK